MGRQEARPARLRARRTPSVLFGEFSVRSRLSVARGTIGVAAEAAFPLEAALSLETSFALEASATLAPETTAAVATIATVAATSTVARLASALSKGEQRKMPSALDRGREGALVLGARARLPSRLDHAAVGDEPANARHVFIVDVLDAIDTEGAHLAARERATAAARAAATAETSPRSFAVAPAVIATARLSLVHQRSNPFQKADAARPRYWLGTVC